MIFFAVAFRQRSEYDTKFPIIETQDTKFPIIETQDTKFPALKQMKANCPSNTHKKKRLFPVSFLYYSFDERST